MPGAGTRPSTRPSIPDLAGGGRPSTLPGGNLPARPGGGLNLPGAGARPSPGDLGDFLGMDRPLRPDTLPAPIRPGTPGRPGIDAPGIGARPGIERPGLGRPGFDYGRPGLGDRPINIGEINLGNNGVINKRPSWVNIDNNRVNTINNRWQNQIGGINNWPARYPNRMAYWNTWGRGVRGHWFYHNQGWFGASWWAGHQHAWCGWHYGYWFNRYPWSYWWRVPTYANCVRWFTWSAPAAVWAQPVYYDYGQGGNVVYQDNSVYINGELVATSDEFAQSAMNLATVTPPASEEAAAKVEWMPLGTFGVSTSEKDIEPTRVIQLAVSKEGIISGTLYNTQTDQAQSVQGQVDKNTQRVAMRIGESDKVVVETGLYNLTQNEAPLLVHFGAEKVENWLLVRMDAPEDGESSTAP